MKIFVKNLVRYEVLVVVGILMSLGTAIKLMGIADFSSDWFWFLAGIGLTIEGFIYLLKQRRFDQKYEIIKRKR